MFKIVNTDNFGSDYPDERFLGLVPQNPSTIEGILLRQDVAQRIADILNEYGGPHDSRFWKIVPQDYKLQPGFSP